MPPKSNRHFEKHFSSSSSLYFPDYPISLDFNYSAGGKGGGKGEGKGEGGLANASPAVITTRLSCSDSIFTSDIEE
jgi:hypothetical protein